MQAESDLELGTFHGNIHVEEVLVLRPFRKKNWAFYKEVLVLCPLRKENWAFYKDVLVLCPL